MRAKHCAALEYNNKIVAISVNHYGNDSTGLSTHAEQSVHKKYLKMKHKLKQRRKYNLWVFRYSDASGAMNSKPCQNCTKFIKESMPHVNKVFYSYDNKRYICQDKKHLKSNHVSLGNQHILDIRCNC